MKTYVITLAKTFPANHFRAGEPTQFHEKLIRRDKIHTIRTNYNFWLKRIHKINNGEGYLSIRQWQGKPYNSKQVEIARFTYLCYEKINISTKAILINGKGITKPMIKKLSANDGLTTSEFYDWFKPEKRPIKDAIIIHFTNFRYGKE